MCRPLRAILPAAIHSDLSRLILTPRDPPPPALPRTWRIMRAALLHGLDAWLVENELCREVAPPTMLAQITHEDLQLVCWEAVGV